MSRYWFLLTSDPIIKNYVSVKPSITFPRSRSFRDLTSSHFDPVDNATNQLGTFKSGACAYCDNLDTRSSAKLPDGTTWHSRTLCGLFYQGDSVLNCACGAFYVGITRREFHGRIYHHVYLAFISYYKSPIGRHVTFGHNYKHVHLTFIPLTHIFLDPRGGDWERLLFQAEAWWIFKLKALTLLGLNDSLSFEPFL